MRGIEERLSNQAERRYKKKGLGFKGLILLAFLSQISCPPVITYTRSEPSGSSSEEPGSPPTVSASIVDELSEVVPSEDVASYEDIINAHKSGYSAITETDGSLTLAWDPSTSSSIAKYQIGYKERFTDSWKILGEVSGGRENLEFIVDTLDDGIYEFEVRAVAYNTEKSDWHNSTDSTASPSNGWFLVYKNLHGAIHPVDTDADEIVSTQELVNYIDLWNAESVEDNDLSVAIDLWLTYNNLL